MEVAFVVQRYGKEIIGGAESHARQIAERLARVYSWRIHIFTTTAKDYLSWAPAYEEGIESLNGVLVHRFHVVRQRNIRLFNLVSRILIAMIKRIPVRFLWTLAIKKNLEKFWYGLQGPVCPKLIEELCAQEKFFEKVFFFTYLYYPTLFGLEKLAAKSVLIPTIHDEPPFYFWHTRRLLRSAKMIFTNTEVEKELITKSYPEVDVEKKLKVVGLGFDDPVTSDSQHTETPIFNNHPIPKKYLLYLGRIGFGKNTHHLLDYFLTFCQAFPAHEIYLILAGQADNGFTLPRSENVLYLGPVSDENKKWLLCHATCVVNPSKLESLSMLALEAMAARIPLLVNGASEVLAHYAAHTQTVFAYADKDEFYLRLNQILQIDWQTDVRRLEQLDQTRQWSLQHYSWQRVLDHYRTSVTMD